jgi:hypothetical protein
MGYAGQGLYNNGQGMNNTIEIDTIPFHVGLWYLVGVVEEGEYFKKTQGKM